MRDFEAFAAIGGRRLEQALLARFGPDIGADLHADAMAKAWAEWPRIGAMTNPAGYLWRVAESDARRYRRWRRSPPIPERSDSPLFTERDIFWSLGSLSDRERVAVILVHAHRATYQEVADLLGVPTTTVTNLVHRGLAKIRHDLAERP